MASRTNSEGKHFQFKFSLTSALNTFIALYSTSRARSVNRKIISASVHALSEVIACHRTMQNIIRIENSFSHLRVKITLITRQKAKYNNKDELYINKREIYSSRKESKKSRLLK